MEKEWVENQQDADGVCLGSEWDGTRMQMEMEIEMKGYV